MFDQLAVSMRFVLAGICIVAGTYLTNIPYVQSYYLLKDYTQTETQLVLLVVRFRRIR